jgi:hypothetical protein
MPYRVLDEGPGLAIELQWSRPTQMYGDVQGYRVIYAAKELNIRGEVLKPAHVHSHIFQDLGMMWPVLFVTLLNVCLLFRARSRV